MKILFMGTAPFALPTLSRLSESDHDVIGVVTGVDRPRGRGHSMRETPVAALATDLGLNVFKPASVKDQAFVDIVSDLAPDCIVLVAYGQLIPKVLLDLPPFGAINLHPSLLPKYRGAAPLHVPLLEGDRVTGVTTMYMSEQLDAGDLILQRPIPIGDDDNVGVMHDILADVGAALIVETMDRLEKGQVATARQDESLVRYAPKVNSTEIDWTQRAEEIVRLVRGMTPFPGAYTWLNGKRLKIIRATMASSEPSDAVHAQPGMIIQVEKNEISVGTGQGRVNISHLQPESRRKMSVDEFIQGHDVSVGSMLGSNVERND